MAQWHRFLLGVTRWRLRARLSFYDRLSPQLTALLKDLLTRSLRAQRTQLTHWLEAALTVWGKDLDGPLDRNVPSLSIVCDDCPVRP